MTRIIVDLYPSRTHSRIVVSFQSEEAIIFDLLSLRKYYWKKNGRSE